jgi:CRP-like cAMP-binding protein
LLAALSDREYARISPTLDVISLKLKEFVQRPGEAVSHVYFPGDGFCSALTVLADGTMVEVATIGREGMTGTLNSNYGEAAPSATMVQGAVRTCYRLPAAAFRQEMDRHETLHDVVSNYVDVLTRVIMQSTACNAVHHVEQRLARWLLTAHDHMDKGTFPLTQEFIAMMLGVARPTVASIAGRLHRAGLITNRTGQLTITHREGLEAAACECYSVTAILLKSSTTRQETNRRQM